MVWFFFFFFYKTDNVVLVQICSTLLLPTLPRKDRIKKNVHILMQTRVICTGVLVKIGCVCVCRGRGVDGVLHVFIRYSDRPVWLRRSRLIRFKKKNTKKEKKKTRVNSIFRIITPIITASNTRISLFEIAKTGTKYMYHSELKFQNVGTALNT